MMRNVVRTIAVGALLVTATTNLSYGESEPASKNESGSNNETGAACGKPHAYQSQSVSAEASRSSAVFALTVLAHLSPKSQNATMSPFGLSSVLATLDLGAGDAMRAAISSTLRVADTAKMDSTAASKKVEAKTGENGKGNKSGDRLDALRRASRLLELASERDPQRFASFNAIFVDHRLPLVPGIADLAKADGNVDVSAVDFGSQADIDGINASLAKKTNGRITSILEPGSGSVLVATNALAFKECWKTPFDKSSTADRPFTRADGSKIDTPTMSLTSDAVLYRKNDGFVAAELAYVDEDFALTLVTTDGKPGKIADFGKVAPLLAGVGLAEANVSLQLPKFRGAADNELLDILSEMGLKPALTSADQFPGFSKGLRLGRVRQKTWLSVDEQGTEAAAVTTAETTRSALEPKSVSANFDRPFVYALRHRPTGTILMAGYVGDPAGAEKN